ncbi:hypothetical protein EV421DRAFT_1913008 [Armillaria borealis]|uniref:SUN domain-containing protein n=1 Tax=Armillaria borealis TaxID=47425 RepID=A0AA39ITQ6_9AGAR|nr:hypothetical protein EV421DRAFT_1913008 [Armillaria borealis]
MPMQKISYRKGSFASSKFVKTISKPLRSIPGDPALSARRGRQSKMAKPTVRPAVGALQIPPNPLLFLIVHLGFWVNLDSAVGCLNPYHSGLSGNFQDATAHSKSLYCGIYISGSLSVEEYEMLLNKSTALIQSAILATAPPAPPAPQQDHALLSNGAKVIAELTSVTYMLDRLPLSSKIKLSMFGTDPCLAHIASPKVVFRENEECCWSFKGNHGHVSIKLSDRIHPTHFVAHGPPPLLPLSDDACKQFPCHIVLWGRIKENHTRSGNYAQSDLTLANRFHSSSRRIPQSLSMAQFLKLATYEYPFDDPSSIQDVSLSLNVSIDALTIEVTDNWGGDVTCLHRMGILGVISTET